LSCLFGIDAPAEARQRRIVNILSLLLWKIIS
jgi:hypothetical protein